MTHQDDKHKDINQNPEDSVSEDIEFGVTLENLEALAENAPATAPAENELSIEEKLAQTKDQLLRALAECENIRKRSTKEREEVAQYAITKFARDLLAVADNLSRAIDAGSKDEADIKVVLEGVEITQKELQKVFERYGIKTVNPQGETFDHNLHQAMFEVESEEHPQGQVINVLQHGYVLQDRLLRPALVSVSKGKA